MPAKAHLFVRAIDIAKAKEVAAGLQKEPARWLTDAGFRFRPHASPHQRLSRRMKTSTSGSTFPKARRGCFSSGSRKSSPTRRPAHHEAVRQALPSDVERRTLSGLGDDTVLFLFSTLCSSHCHRRAAPTTTWSILNPLTRRSSSSCATPPRRTSPATPFTRPICRRFFGQRPRHGWRKRKSFSGLAITDSRSGTPTGRWLRRWNSGERTHNGDVCRRSRRTANGSLHTWGVAVDATLVDDN